MVILIGAAVTATAVSFHYLHAAGLEAGGSFGWVPPDNQHVRFTHDYDGNDVMVIPARPNHWQTFSIQVHNPSSVTQTILGDGGSGLSREPDRLTVSTTSTALGDELAADYAAGPVDVPPGAVRTVRLSTYAAGCDVWGPVSGPSGRGETWTYLVLQVRVGAFTRSEKLTFGGQAVELQGTGGVC